MTAMPRAIVYVRVGDPAASPDVIERQLRDATAIADEYGFDIVDVARDVGRSSTDPDRPGFQRVLAAGHAKEADVVVATTWVRLARTVRQFQQLHASGLRIVTGEDVDQDDDQPTRHVEVPPAPGRA